MSSVPARLPTVGCPVCGCRQTFAVPGSCPECGAQLFEQEGRRFDAIAVERRVDAGALPKILGDALRRWRAAGRGRLLEVHQLSLPYWQAPNGQLMAAFPTAIDAARQRPVPATEPTPADLTQLPVVPARVVAPEAHRLILLPAFDVCYAVRGRRFHAIIDAHHGEVLADLRPHPWQARIQLWLAVVLLVDVGVFATAATLAPNSLVRTVLILALVAPVYGWTRVALQWTDRRRQ